MSDYLSGSLEFRLFEKINYRFAQPFFPPLSCEVMNWLSSGSSDVNFSRSWTCALLNFFVAHHQCLNHLVELFIYLCAETRKMHVDKDLLEKCEALQETPI